MSRQPVPRTPATETDLAKLRALARCTFLPGSFDKRWTRDVCHQVDEGLGLTEKQRAMLDKMIYRYRRQIGTADRGWTPLSQAPLFDEMQT